MKRTTASLFLSLAVLLFAGIAAGDVRPSRPKAQDHECGYRQNAGCGITVEEEVNIYGCRDDEFFYFNVYRVFLTAGRNYQFTMAALSNNQSPDIGITEVDGESYLVRNVGPKGGSATVNFTPSTSNYYFVYVGPGERLEVGRYRLTMECDVTAPPACVSSANAVCLLNNRFRVSIAYVNPFSNPPNQPGTFLAARLQQGAQNPDVGLFGFSSAQAVEVVVRIQDTRPFAPRFDVYYGGLTDVAYTVTVTDTVTGLTRQYNNPVGRVGGGVDRTSFPAN